MSKPATKAQIRASLPSPRAMDKDMRKMDRLWATPSNAPSLSRIARVRYGPYAKLLTRSLVRKFMGQRLFVISGGHHYDVSYPQATPPATRNERMKMVETLVPLKFWGNDLESRWSQFPGEEQDYIYFDRDGEAVTGSGADPIFVFLKPPSPKKRGPRKAPAAHARNMAGRYDIGSDGKLWVSIGIGPNRYRWMPVHRYPRR